ncbi:hypothetical protein V2K41_11870 [Pseudomonas alliivorans]|nr:hypothetical protein [Pseudomonas alliivorans]
MSDLKKLTLTVKNFNLQVSSELDALYSQVRCEDALGKTFHFKQVVMLQYLSRHGAMVTDTPRTWYYKHLSKKAIVLVAFEKNNGKVEYDLDHMKATARSSVLKGIVYALAAVPAGIIVATATYGAGLLLIPMFLYGSYKCAFKFPKMFRRQTLINDLAQHGIVVK